MGELFSKGKVFNDSPEVGYHWIKASLDTLPLRLRDYDRAGFKIISISQYGWIFKSILIIYKVEATRQWPT